MTSSSDIDGGSSIGSPPDVQAALLKTVVEAAETFAYSVDRQYRYTAFSARHAAAIKAQHDLDVTIGGSPLDHRRGTADWIETKRLLDRALSGERFTIEIARWGRRFECLHEPVRDPSGEVLGVAVFAHDVTALQETAAALRECELRRLSLFDSMDEGVALCEVIFDAAGRPDDFRVLELNPSGERLTAIRDAVGRKVTELVPGVKEAAPELLDVVGRAVTAGRPQRHEIYFAPLEKWFSVSLSVPAPGRFLAVFTDITCRKETEEQFRTFFDDAPIGKSMTAPDGRLLRVNPAFCAMLGYTPDELSALTYVDVTHPDDVAVSRECVRSLLSGKRPTWRFDKRYITRDGRVVWAHVTTRLRRDPSGKPLHLLTHILDITSRRQAEDALRESEAWLRLAQQIAGVGSFDWDLETGQVRWNEQAYRQLGLAPGEMTPSFDAFLKYIHPDDRAELLARSERTLADGVPFDLELRLVHADGTERVSHSRAELLRGPDGRPQRLVGVSLDITARKRAELEISEFNRTLEQRVYERTAQLEASVRDLERVQEERARLVTAIQQAAESIIVTDARARIQYVNPAFEVLTGYTLADVAGQTPRVLKSGRHDEAFYRGLWEAIGEGRTWRGRIVNRRKDGALYTEDTTISAVRDAAGAIVSYVAVKRDITRELQLEEQLQQAQKMESIGRLAGGVAQDFNNLLLGLRNYVEFALEEPSIGAQTRDDLNSAVALVERAAGLTGQLLAFSRKQALAKVTLNVNDLIAALTKMLARVLGEHVDVRFVAAPGLGNTSADPGQIEQVIVNLAINARDAMPDGGRIVIETSNVTLSPDDVALRPDVSQGRYVLITVTDTGCGMDEQIQGRLFEPFFTTKELGKGTGLGLATVFGIVKQHGGDIRVQSEPGMGSTFKVYLPRTDEPARDRLAPAAVPKKGTETILLVEDDESVRKATCRVIEKLGYVVLSATGARDAEDLMALRGGEIDLLLTDVVMPERNGRQLYDSLVTRFPGLRVLFMSGYTDQIIGHEGTLGPGIAFLQKPFSRHELAAKIRHALDARATAAPPDLSA
ncbi:MAG: PAS domain S-box protein [Deltaproteobacteria bacterium]|nr:PAS domain S-box protein [Deltaproteobacteria bacterium]